MLYQLSQLCIKKYRLPIIGKRYVKHVYHCMCSYQLQTISEIQFPRLCLSIDECIKAKPNSRDSRCAEWQLSLYLQYKRFIVVMSFSFLELFRSAFFFLIHRHHIIKTLACKLYSWYNFSI